jgi:hypothetical protein
MPGKGKVEEVAAHKRLLDGEIETFRAKLNAFIDEYAAGIAKGTPGVPLESIRQSIIGGSGHCPCTAALHVLHAIRRDRKDASRQS